MNDDIKYIILEKHDILNGIKYNQSSLNLKKYGEDVLKQQSVA